MSIKPSPIGPDEVSHALGDLMNHHREHKRKYVPTLELQVGIQNYNYTKDKRFSGTLVLPHTARYKMNIMVIADEVAKKECIEYNIPYIDNEGIRAFNKNKKIIKKWAKPFHYIIASSSIIRLVPRIMGPQLNKMAKFPSVIEEGKTVRDKISEVYRTVVLRLRKVPCIHVAVGNMSQSEEQLHENVMATMNYLVTLTKYGWGNIQTVHLKSTQSPCRLVYRGEPFVPSNIVPESESEDQ